jgi:hypothetical protein
LLGPRISPAALTPRHSRTVQRRPVASGCYGAQLVQIGKNPPKIRFEQFVKLTDYTYACNSLTNFEYKAETEMM